MKSCPPRDSSGFTLVELLVVLAVLAVLAGIAVPNYIDRIDQAREAVLRHDLQALRVAIDQFFRDKGRYPRALEELVDARYVRALPVDPITGRSDTWVLVPPGTGGASTGVFDVRSGASGQSKDGTFYASW